MALLLLCDSHARLLFRAPLHVEDDGSIALPFGVLSATRINQVEFAITIGETLVIFLFWAKFQHLVKISGFCGFPSPHFKKEK
jgi:hypothetical protein